MMTRYWLSIIAILVSQLDMLACDACGCSIMGQPAGLLSSYRRSFLSLGWSHAGFSATPGAGEGATDAFQTLDLSFDYYFSDRLRAGVYLPFRMNTRIINQFTTSVSGLADTRMDVTYTFFKQNDGSFPLEIYLDAGAGLIIPTGNYNPNIHDQNLPENFNPGNGSFGISFQQTSGFSWRALGAVLKNTWTEYGDAKTGYAYGSQWAANLLVLADIPLDSSISVVPLGSLQYEKVWQDAYATGADVHGTGGYGWFLSPGCQVKIKNWLCTFQYSIPFQNHYGNGEVIAGNRYSLQLTHLF